jgi:hypothetical protein
MESDSTGAGGRPGALRVRPPQIPLDTASPRMLSSQNECKFVSDLWENDMRLVLKVVNTSTEILNRAEMLDARIRQYYYDLKEQGWTFLATTQRRGWCNEHFKIITIPTWVMQGKSQASQEGYFVWYLSHEMAHAFAGYKAMHGIVFQKKLQEICPPEYLKYEMPYKGTNATRAGIHSVMEMSLEELL